MDHKSPIYVPDEGKLGPAMAALTERQRAFVVACLSTGRNNNTAHARMAGYTGDDETLRVTAHRLAHDEKVMAAMKEEGERRLKSSAIMATSVLVNIAENAPENKDRLKAIDMILNRIGMHTVTESKTTVTHTLDEKQMVARIEQLCKTLGIEPQKLLGRSATIDAEFKEVPAEVTDGREGLEDLL